MNDDRGTQLLLMVGAAILGLILYLHFFREKPPLEAMQNLAPDGTQIVTPRPQDLSPAETQTASPHALSAKERSASEQAWREGRYQVVPAKPGVLVLDNGIERKSALTSDLSMGPCRFQRGPTCLHGPGLEVLVTDRLPYRFRRHGSTALERRNAPRAVTQQRPGPRPPIRPEPPPRRINSR